jgi:hypothetical protein
MKAGQILTEGQQKVAGQIKMTILTDSLNGGGRKKDPDQTFKRTDYFIQQNTLKQTDNFIQQNIKTKLLFYSNKTL